MSIAFVWRHILAKHRHVPMYIPTKKQFKVTVIAFITTNKWEGSKNERSRTLRR